MEDEGFRRERGGGGETEGGADRCVLVQRGAQCFFCWATLLVCKHVQSPTEPLSAEQGQEDFRR